MMESTELRATRLACVASFLISALLFNKDGVRYSKAGMAVVADLETRYILEHCLSPHGT